MGCIVTSVIVLIGAVIALMQKNVPMLVGILYIGFGIQCFVFFLQKKNEAKNELSKIKDIETIRIKDIINICNNVKEEMGKGGYFKMMVAVEGSIKECNSSLHTVCVEDDTGKILVKPDDKKDYGIDIIAKKAFRTLYNNIYIVGEASDISGKLMIQQPKYFNNPFVIALKSRQEHINQREKEAKNILGYINNSFFILCGIICLIVSLI